MRRRSTGDSDKEEASLQYFYEEPLHKDNYDVQLIKDLFQTRKIKFNNEMRMKRFFRSDAKTLTTHTVSIEKHSQTGGSTYSRAESTSSADL